MENPHPCFRHYPGIGRKTWWRHESNNLQYSLLCVHWMHTVRREFRYECRQYFRWRRLKSRGFPVISSKLDLTKNYQKVNGHLLHFPLSTRIVQKQKMIVSEVMCITRGANHDNYTDRRVSKYKIEFYVKSLRLFYFCGLSWQSA